MTTTQLNLYNDPNDKRGPFNYQSLNIDKQIELQDPSVRVPKGKQKLLTMKEAAKKGNGNPRQMKKKG